MKLAYFIKILAVTSVLNSSSRAIEPVSFQGNNVYKGFNSGPIHKFEYGDKSSEEDSVFPNFSQENNEKEINYSDDLLTEKSVGVEKGKTIYGDGTDSGSFGEENDKNTAWWNDYLKHDQNPILTTSKSRLSKLKTSMFRKTLRNEQHNGYKSKQMNNILEDSFSHNSREEPWTKVQSSDDVNNNGDYPISDDRNTLDDISFPQREILNKISKMIISAQNLKQIEFLEAREILPGAQRRYAEQQTVPVSDRFKLSKWDLQSVHFTTITVGTLMLFIILVVMVLALRIHCSNREKSAQEWIRHPIVQPSTATTDGIQPNFKQILHPESLNSEPIRIKTKGLLERRGSNTSLTIDLGSGCEGGDFSFPPSRECTPEDFLLTAGSRMNRKQLRQCLRDPRGLHDEFWQIPTNHPDKSSVPGAAAKNRYRTVLPNEESRVILRNAPPDSPETPASQYINANYIKGYDNEEKAYIATQGPLAHTIEDLWLLVLHEKSPALVMITRLKEKGRVKCEPYIPSYAATYGSITITVKQVIQKNGYTIRQIFIKRGDEVHTTLHFWFTSWPDHKAPASARHLLAMSTDVENARKESQRPVIVHCSAGIGRTGCFIAVSNGKMQLLEEDCVDVLSIVCQMRLDRGGMVQTAEQYEFIHRALALFEAALPATASSE